MDVAALDEHLVELAAHGRVERNRARLVVRRAVGVDRDGGGGICALARLDDERRELHRREDGRALEDGKAEALRHLRVVGVREDRVEHVVAALFLEAGAEVVEVHRLKSAEPAKRAGRLLREKPFFRRGLVYLEADAAEIRASDHLLEKTDSGVAGLRVGRIVELAARCLVERARLGVDDHRALWIEAGHLEDVLVLLDIGRVGAGAEDEADVGRIRLVALGRLRREKRRDSVVDDGDSLAAGALQKFLADELPDDCGGLDVLRPADELGVEVLRRLGRVGEAPAELLAAGLAFETLHLGRERVVERLLVDFALGAGHRLVLLVGDFRRNRDDCAAEIRAARVKHRGGRALGDFAVHADERGDHHKGRRLSLEALLHFGDER